MFFFPFWGVWSCSSCTVSELAQPLPCGWVAGLLEFCRVKLSNVGPGQCLDGRPKSFLPWLQEEREPSFRTAPCRAFAHICRDVAYFSVTAFAPNSCNLLLQMLVNPAFASAFVQFEVFASTTYFCLSHACNLSPILCWRPVENGVIANMFAWRQVFQPWKRGFCIQDGICFRKQESCILPAYLRNVSLDPVAHFYLRRSQQVNRSQIYLFFFFSSSWQVPNWRP